MMLNVCKYFIVVVLSIVSFNCTGQDSFYNKIELGSYDVGFYNTIIYNDSINYDAYGYRGSRPIFLQIWHPIKHNNKVETLTYGDFKNKNIPDSLKDVYGELCSQSDRFFISYNISETFGTYDPINYGKYTKLDVLNEIKKFKTQSTYNNLTSKSNFPVIVYHHGTQGVSEENFIMAEYFASRGYIFISANYHLPYPNQDYGAEESLKNNQSTLEIVSGFAKSLTSNKYLFFIGHSWGAQVGWTALHKKGLADGFVSMETTIENKKDTTEIKSKWAYVYDALKTKKNKLSIPVLMFSNIPKNEPFTFFVNSSTKPIMFVSPKIDFGHESYTSAYLMRYFLRDKFAQPDEKEIKDQSLYYKKNLELINDFLNSVENEKAFNKNKEDSFYYFNY